jgi:hypothetical protein
MSQIHLVAFDFISEPQQFTVPKRARVAVLPPFIEKREELFSYYKRQLVFPYFGENWDSFEELMSDFSWLPTRHVVVLHQDLPPLPHGNISTYLDILRSCVLSGRESEDYELQVVFPVRERERIARL